MKWSLTFLADMLASKAGSARTSLMLKFKDDVPAGGLLFTFTAASKEADRQAVQDVLIPFVAANRGAPAAAPTPAAPSAVAGPSTGAGPSGIASAVGTPAGSAPGTPGTPSSVARAGKRKLDDGDAEARRRANNLRVRVLRKNPTLMLLHRELVIGKQISEEEFWDGREALLKAEELAYEQRPGRPSRLLDDRFDIAGNKSKSGKIQGGTGVGLKKVETGPIVLNITKDLTREIFEEFPVVQDAYAKNVPRVSLCGTGGPTSSDSDRFPRPTFGHDTLRRLCGNDTVRRCARLHWTKGHVAKMTFSMPTSRTQTGRLRRARRCPTTWKRTSTWRRPRRTTAKTSSSVM